MMYVFEVASGAMIYMRSFIQIGSVRRREFTYRKHGRRTVCYSVQKFVRAECRNPHLRKGRTICIYIFINFKLCITYK
jgi:hypothetical protein